MHKKTSAILVLIVVLLGGLAWWQTEREADQRFLVDERMFEGVDVSRVVEIRIDNINRSYTLRLQRDSAGSWFLTDPLAVPANLGLVQLLLDDISTARVMALPEAEADGRGLGFEPPRVVLDVVEATDAGPRTTRVEVGALDLDGKRVHVRREGRYLRGLRRIWSTLDRSPEEFRSHRILHLAGRKISEVHRTGSVQYAPEELPQNLGLHAYLDGAEWRSVLPFEARLDPLDVGVLVYGLARIQVRRFVEDDASDLARYGLDRPLVRLSLGFRDGSRETLLLSRIGNSSNWFVKQPGNPAVFSIEDPAAVRLLYPLEAMLETHFSPVDRESVEAIEFLNGDLLLRLERGFTGWQAKTRRGSGAWSAERRADEDLVADCLGRLETLEIEEFLLDGQPRLEGTGLAIHLETRDGRWGGTLGPLWQFDGAEERRTYLRDGDERWGLVPLWTADLARLSARELWSLDLLQLEEVEQASLRLVRGELELNFKRDERGFWHGAGEPEEARDLLAVLDALLFLRASEHLEGEVALENSISVHFGASAGGGVSFEVGLGPEGTCQLSLAGARSLARIADLHSRLLDLFSR
ncbi:MAG TPA: DUF4340 domain-containing protein [Planctomycetes bacterium]|nr:DUF4340 domain-containing protein [Planctomycetota bacterium]